MTQLEVIWKFMASLSDSTTSDAQKMLDTAIRACSDYDGIDAALEEFTTAAQLARNSTTFLAECGIDVTNADTGGITGSDAGGSTTKTSDTTVLEIANAYAANANATAAQNIHTGTNGWHVQATAFNDTIISGGEDSIDAGAGNDFIALNSSNSVIITGGDNDTISVGAAVKYFTVKDFSAGKTTILGANNFSTVATDNGDGTKTVTYTRNGSASAAATLDASNASVDLSKVNTLKGYFDGNGNFVGNSTLASGNFLGNVTSDFDPSFLDVDASGNLSFTYRGLKLNIIGQRNPSTKAITYAINSSNIDSLKGDWRYVIIAGLYKWWLKEALDLNAEATGLGFTDGTATVAEMNLYFENYTSQSWLAYVSSSYYTENGQTAILNLVVNQRYFGSVSNEDDPNCVVSGGQLDRTIAHEFNHAVFAANVNYFAYLPIFIKEGMAELIHGIDDKRLGSMQSILRNTVNGNSKNWLADYVKLDVLNSSQVSTLKGGTAGAAYPYAAGYMFLRWLAKNASDDATIFADEEISARVELRTDGVYYISGTRHLQETAKLVSFGGEYTGVSVGSAAGNVYTLNSAIKQLVTYFNTKAAWNIAGVGDNVTIMADDSATGGDSIVGGGSGILIQSGAGNDTISVTGSGNTIDGGTGNDYIFAANISASTILGGDGVDTIRIGNSVSGLTLADLDPSDVLVLDSSISSANFNSSTKTLTLGNATVILPNAGGKLVSFRKMVVQNGSESTTLGRLLGIEDGELFEWTISGKTATCSADGVNIFTLSVTNFASGLTAYALEEILDVLNSNGAYSVAFADGKSVGDLIGAGTANLNGATWELTSSPSSTIAAGWNISGTAATYKTAEVIAGYVVSADSKKITYTAASGGNSLVTVSGLRSGAAASGLTLSGTTVTLSNGVLNQGTVTVSDGYRLALASDVTKSTDAAASWSISGTTATYTRAATTAGYVLASDGKTVTYNTASGGGTLFTVTGLRENASTGGLSLDGTVVTLSSSVLGQTAVGISNGYTLALASGVPISTTTAAHWDISGTTAAYKTTQVTAGYVLASNSRSVSYNAASGGDTLVTVTGLKRGADTSGLSLSGTTVTLSADVLNEGTVTVSDGYTLRLGSGVITPKNTAAGWNVDGTVATYGAAGTTAGYVVSSDGRSVTYNAASRETLITLYGVKENAAASGFSISGKVVTLAASVLGESSIYLAGDYTLALGRNIVAPVSTAAHWEISGGVAEYKSVATTEGYALSGDAKSVQYTAAGGGDTLVTISGLREGVAAGDISMVRKIVALTAGMVDGSTVTISEGYTLRLASSLAKPAAVAAHWSVGGGAASYIDDAVSAGYVLSEDSRTAAYQEATGGDTLLTISGLSTNATAAALSISDTTVTVSAAALNQSTVKISSGYNLALGGNVTTPATTAAHWNISNGTANYIGEATSAGYVIENNQIEYKAASGGDTLLTISGLSANATAAALSLNDTTVTVSAAALNQGTVKISGGYNLAIGSGVVTPATTAAHWNISNGTASYISEATSAGYVLENNQIEYKAASGGDTLLTISGLSSSATAAALSLNDTTVTVSAAALNQGTVKISSGYNLALGSGVVTPATTAAHWNISNGTASYIGEATSAGYFLENNQIEYKAATGGDTLLTITGLSANAAESDISLSGTTVTVSAAALNQGTVKISSGYSLALGGNVVTPATTAAHWNISNGTANYIGEATSAGYVIENNQVEYKAASGGDTLLTISGLSSSATAAALSLSDTTVTVSAAALNQGTVKISGGYSFALGGNVVTPATTAAHWNISSGTASYISEATSAGYVIENNQINYKAATGGDTLLTISGLSSSATAAALSLSDTTVTVSAAALNQGTVKISGGYSLALGGNVTTPATTAAHWNISNGTASYIDEATSAGYVIENNQINYKAATGGDTLLTISGLSANATAAALSISDTTVTISVAALNQGTVKISSGYNLALGGNVVKPATTAAHWNISNGTASYIGEATSAGYVIENNQINYKAASGGDTLLTITGLSANATAAALSLSDTTVTVSAAALNQGTVKISGGYNLALGGNVTTPATTAAHWNISNGTASYIGEATSAGYVIENNQINYKAATGGDTLLTISGLSTNATAAALSLSDTTVTVSAAALNGSTVKISAGYSLALAADVKISTTTDAHWEISGGTATYVSKTTSVGYALEGGGTEINYFEESGDEALITIDGLRDGVSVDDLQVDGTVIILTAEVLDERTVTVSEGYTLRLAGDVAVPTTTAAHWSITGGAADYISEAVSAGYVLAEDATSVDYNPATGGDSLFTISGLSANAAESDISLSGTTVTISAGALGTDTMTISEGYTLALAGDVTVSTTTAAHWEISNGTAAYLSGSNSSGYTLENNQIVYNSATGGDALVTVTGLNATAAESDVALNDTTVTISEGALGTDTVTISEGYTLALAGDVTVSTTTAAHWEISNGTAAYLSEANSAGYTLENNQIAYTDATGGDALVTITGLNATAAESDITLSGTTVTISAGALGTETVTISEGYSLALADDVTVSTTTAAHWDISNGTAAYISDETSAGYTLENNQITYSAGTGGDALVTITGLSDTAAESDIALSGSTVTISEGALGTDTVTISEGYTLALANDVPAPTPTAAHWQIADGTAVYLAESNSAGYTLENNQITYSAGTGGDALVTITGLSDTAAESDIALSGSTVTISAAALGTETVTISEGYTLALADDVPAPAPTAAHWQIADGTATYLAESNSAGYTLENNQIAYTDATGGDALVTITGLSDTAAESDIALSGSTVTISAAALGTETVTISAGYTLALAGDVTVSTTTAAHWEIASGTAAYLSEANSAGYTLENNQITYSAGTGGAALVTITGLSDTAAESDIALSGTTVTISAGALGTDTVRASSGYSLALGSDATAPVTTAAHWEIANGTATYLAAATSAGYTLRNNQITYSAATGGETLATITGLSDTAAASDLTLSGTIVTVNAAALGQTNATITAGYRLRLGSGTSAPSTTAAHWQIADGTANYIAAETTAGYTLTNNSRTIAYTAHSGGNTLFTITGLRARATASGLSLRGTTITLAASVLGASTVNVTNGYTLALAEGVTTPARTEAHWEVSGTSAVYRAASISAGYILSNGDRTVNYAAGSGGSVMTTVSGLKSGASTDSLSLSGNVVTISAEALNQRTVSITNNYTLALDADVAVPTKIAPAWSVSGTTGTYSDEITTAGYTVASDRKTIAYSAQTGGATLANVYGLKNNAPASGISTSGNEIILSSSVIGSGNVSVSSGYQLTLDTGSYNAVTLRGGTGADTLNNRGNGVVVNSGGGADKISNTGSRATLDAGAGNDTLTNSGANVIINAGAGNDVISLSGNAANVTVNAGTGNDTIYGDGGRHVYRYASGDGKDLISGFNERDTLKLTSGSIEAASVSGNDVIFTIGNGAITLTGAKGKKITTEDKTGVATLIYSDNMIYDASRTSATLTASYTGTFAAENSVWNIDGSAATSAINIVGNARANTIYGGAKADSLYGGSGADVINGGAGNDTLNGGAGNDTLTGGNGRDVFVYADGDGDDLITDYNASQDKIKLTSGSVTSVSLSGSDVVMKIGSGSITLANAKNKKITVVDADNATTTRIYSENMTYDGSRTAVTLASNFRGTLGASDYSASVRAIDATKVTAAVEIIGNAQANTITAGKKGSTILGGNGNDILIGGAGEDVLYGGAGNDSVYGGAGNDTLSGGAGNDTLTGGDGKNLFLYANGDGRDTITDYTAGSDAIQITSGSVSGSSVRGSDVIFTVGSGSITVKDGKDKKITLVDASGNSDTKIYSAGFIYNENKTALTLTSAFSGALASSVYSSSVLEIDGAQTARGVTVAGNAKANTITGGSGADSLAGGGGNDILIGGAGDDSLFGGSGNDTLTGGAGSDVFVYGAGDGFDVITDYEAGKDKIKITSGSIASVSVKASDVIFKVGSGSVTVKDGKDQKITIVDAANKTSTKIYSAGMTYDENKTSVTLSSSFRGTLNASDYAATVTEIDASAVPSSLKISGNAKANTIIGTAKADSLAGGAGNDVLLGGRGNDTLEGGAGNDTLTGGAGNDIFVYSSGDGHDVITDYAAGQDRIKLNSGSISGGSVSGADVVLNVGTGSITLLDAADKAITVVDANKKVTTTTYTSSGLIYDEQQTAATVTAVFAGTLDADSYASTVRKIDASTASTALKIYGNARANTITGGARADYIEGGAGNDVLIGGAGNDTLWGGAGNDTLTGGAGADIFVFGEGEGNDVITDYAAGQDRIRLTSGSVSRVSLKGGTDVVLKVGSNTLTLKDARGKQITVVDAENKVSTYSYPSAVSGSSAAAVSALFEDDNYMTADANLSDIVEIDAADFTATHIDTPSFANLAQASYLSVTAYSSKK